MANLYDGRAVRAVADIIAYQMLYARQYGSFDRRDVDEINSDDGWTYDTPSTGSNWVRHENVHLTSLELDMAYALAHHIEGGMTVTALIQRPAWHKHLDALAGGN